MIIPYNDINATIRAWRCACGNDCCGDIMSYLAQIDINKKGSTTPFINNLEIIKVFKDKDEEEEVSVMDFIK